MQIGRLLPHLAAVLMIAWPACASPAEPVRLLHSPPRSVRGSEPLLVEATISGDLPLELMASADIAVAEGDGGIGLYPMSRSRNALFGEIPAASVRQPELRYYIRVTTTDGRTIATPSGAPEAGFFVVPVNARSTAPAEGDAHEWEALSVDIVSPQPGEVIAGDTTFIAATFEPPLERPFDAVLTLDGADVTDQADVTADVAVLRIPRHLTPGAHRVTLSAITAAGVAEASWVFFAGEITSRDTADVTRVPPEVYAREATWNVVGRVEVGWAHVGADTVEGDTTDVYLPYDVGSRPTVDLYASGLKGDRSVLATFRYYPVYGADIDWSLETTGRRFDLRIGNIYPSLSRTTLDWASGLGGGVTARFGATTAELVAMRMSEADTLGGFGIYSRFATGARASRRWNEHLSTSLVYLSVFDREESVPEEQRLSDPLVNHVAACVLEGAKNGLSGELEIAAADASGDIEGSGVAFRARAGWEKDLDNRLFLEYATSEEGYYSAGSFERDPGETTLELEFAVLPREPLRTSGWVRVGWPPESRVGVPDGAIDLKLYGRVDVSSKALAGDARAYLMARYDRVPYEAYDYVYSYGALGGSWRRQRSRASLGLSFSRSRSPEPTDLWSATLNLERDLIEDLWRAGLSGRWTAATGEDGKDYARYRYALESRWSWGDADLEAEYWLLDSDDAADPSQSYTEHVFLVSIGSSF
ncbi:MAG: hypothetical protein GF400_02475 [Candidatus Eisenbacteria bacterium]|nr:hypothetical protein [Candidatus Eisenbacteria bacterium]